MPISLSRGCPSKDLRTSLQRTLAIMTIYGNALTLYGNVPTLDPHVPLVLQMLLLLVLVGWQLCYILLTAKANMSTRSYSLHLTTNMNYTACDAISRFKMPLEKPNI